ncbi:Conserved_hypothetical protein [Hexamita inflata]|uniref:Transmembrane protein n=1 Tax=Hexamita inflata TaxID=28002 RepID=A0AA86TSX0_9EUKA|nr:Conserved hypothetical protein [Hexamita inflata]
MPILTTSANFGYINVLNNPNFVANTYHLCASQKIAGSIYFTFQQAIEIGTGQTASLSNAQSMMFFVQRNQIFSVTPGTGSATVKLTLYSFDGSIQTSNQLISISSATFSYTIAKDHGWVLAEITGVTGAFDASLILTQTLSGATLQLFNYSENIYSLQYSSDKSFSISSIQPLSWVMSTSQFLPLFDYSSGKLEKQTYTTIVQAQPSSLTSYFLQAQFINAPCYYCSVQVSQNVQVVTETTQPFLELKATNTLVLAADQTQVYAFDVDVSNGNWFKITFNFDKPMWILLSNDLQSGQSQTFQSSIQSTINVQIGKQRYFLNITGEEATNAQIKFEQYLLATSTQTSVETKSISVQTSDESICIITDSANSATITLSVTSQSYQLNDMLYMCIVNLAQTVIVSAQTISRFSVYSGDNYFQFTNIVNGQLKSVTSTFKQETYLIDLDTELNLFEITFDTASTVTIKIVDSSNTVLTTQTLTSATQLQFEFTVDLSKIYFIQIQSSSVLAKYSIFYSSILDSEVNQSISITNWKVIIVKPDSTFNYFVKHGQSGVHYSCANYVSDLTKCTSLQSTTLIYINPNTNSIKYFAVNVTQTDQFTGMQIYNLNMNSINYVNQLQTVFEIGSVLAQTMINIKFDASIDICVQQSSATCTNIQKAVTSVQKVLTASTQTFIFINSTTSLLTQIYIQVFELLTTSVSVSQSSTEKYYYTSVISSIQSKQATSQFVYATLTSGQQYVLVSSDSIDFTQIESQQDSLSVITGFKYVKVICPGTCAYSIELRQDLVPTPGTTSVIAQGASQSLLFKSTGQSSVVMDLCTVAPNSVISLGGSTYTYTAADSSFIIPVPAGATVSTFSSASSVLQAEFKLQNSVQSQYSNYTVKQLSSGYQISFTVDSQQAQQLQSAPVSYKVFVYEETAVSNTNVVSTQCGLQQFATSLTPDVNNDSYPNVVLKVQHKVTSKTRFVVLNQNQVSSTPLAYTGTIASATSTEMIIVAVVSAILAVIGLLIMCSRNLSKRANNKKHHAPKHARPNYYTFETGNAVIDGKFGWGHIMTSSAAVFSVLISFYLTYVFEEHLLKQKYNIRSLSLNSVTAFIFTSTTNDAFVHSEMNPSSQVTYTFTDNALNFTIEKFLKYGNPTYAKLFLNVSGQQFGKFGEMIEFGVDLSVNQRQKIFCDIKTTGKYEYSAVPEILLKNVDVGVYKTTYFTNTGAFNTQCSQTGQSLTDGGNIFIQFTPQTGDLTPTDENQLIISLVFIAFGVLMAIILFINMKKCMGQQLILRQIPEQQLYE